MQKMIGMMGRTTLLTVKLMAFTESIGKNIRRNFMKKKLITILVAMAFQLLVLGAIPLYAANTYTAAWSSVNKHPAAPEWFQDAKFGIYYHWGVYSVPAYGSEWYPRNMYNNGSGEYNYHMSTYGDPKIGLIIILLMELMISRVSGHNLPRN
jgi:hypothetical protein